MAGLISNWTQQATAVIKAQSDPDWLRPIRQQAATQLQQLQDPSRQLESWRYADVDRLSDQAPSGATASPTQSVEPVGEEIVVVLSEAGVEVVGQAPEWLKINRIQNMPDYLWHDMTFDQETAVNLVNTSLFNSGAFIEVEASTAPINLKLIYQFSDASAWQYVRNHIEVTSGSPVAVEERHVSGHINVVNVCKLAESAQLHKSSHIALSPTERFVSYSQFELFDHAQVSNMNRHSGGLLQHHNQVINFLGSHSKYISGSINKSFDNNNISDIVKVNHYYKNNQSEVTHRSIAQDQSQIFNNAKAYVAPGADQSAIEQDLKNILLSEDAKIFSKPELEVYADEVVAAHGSTIGALDEQSLFYLQSRGIDVAQAREIMIESFEQEAQVC